MEVSRAKPVPTSPAQTEVRKTNLRIDVGATLVKIVGRGEKERPEFEPGCPRLTPKFKDDISHNILHPALPENERHYEDS